MRGVQWTPEQIAEMDRLYQQSKPLKLNRIKTAKKIINDTDPELWGVPSLMPDNAIGHPVTFNPVDYGVVAVAPIPNPTFEVPKPRPRWRRIVHRLWPHAELGLIDFAVALAVFWMVLFFAVIV